MNESVSTVDTQSVMEFLPISISCGFSELQIIFLFDEEIRRKLDYAIEFDISLVTQRDYVPLKDLMNNNNWQMSLRPGGLHVFAYLRILQLLNYFL